MKKKYCWVVTLLTDASIQRITNSLLNNGFEIGFKLASGKMAVIPQKPYVSAVLCITLSCVETDDTKVNDSLLKILADLDIPSYSSILSSDKDGIVYVNAGHMPKLPKNNPLKPIPPGPFRKEKNDECVVLQFPKKDKDE